MTTTLDCDVLVIGAGGAGMYAALAAARNGAANVILLDRGLIGRAGATVMAQMTVAVALGEECPDSTDAHLADTLAAGRGLCDESLARLLVGLWVPSSGTVRMDSVEVSSWDKAELGPHLGYLPQDVELFEGSVADNIARFGKVEPERVVAAAKRAGVHDIVLRLSHGEAVAGHEDH